MSCGHVVVVGGDVDTGLGTGVVVVCRMGLGHGLEVYFTRARREAPATSKKALHFLNRTAFCTNFLRSSAFRFSFEVKSGVNWL